MPPCMAELVNTKLSLRLILPRGRKASQIPYQFLFALSGVLWSLPVCKNRSKIQEASERSEMAVWVLVLNVSFWSQQPHMPLSKKLRQGAKIWSQTDVVQILVKPIIGVVPRVSRTGNRLLVCSVPPLSLATLSSTVGHLNCRPASLCWC